MNNELNQLKKRIAELEAENARIQETLIQLEDCNRQLKQGFAELEEQYRKTQTALFRAKDPDEVQKASEKRVRQLANKALMELSRWGRGWIIRFGRSRRWFKNLKDVWLILTTPDWKLSDFFDSKANHIPSRKPRPNKNCNLNHHNSDEQIKPLWISPNKLPQSLRDQLEYNLVVRRQYEALRPHYVDFWHQDHQLSNGNFKQN